MPARIIISGTRGLLRFVTRGGAPTARRGANPAAVGGRTGRGATAAVGTAAAGVGGVVVGAGSRSVLTGALAGAGGYFGAEALSGASDAAGSVRSTVRRAGAAMLPAAVAAGAIYGSTQVADPKLRTGLYAVAALAGVKAVKDWSGDE